MKIVTYSLKSANEYSGVIDGESFYIGSRVSFQGNKGLKNTRGTEEQKYNSAKWRERHGFWADFIQPTATCEGSFFHTLNTYDKARFTFSFLQYAAHEPNGDFVEYFRKILTLPIAKEYFNDLVVNNGRICKISASGIKILEDDHSTDGLMAYLNPTLAYVEDVEIIQAAKFIHWVQTDLQHREIMVGYGIDLFKKKMHGYAMKYNLDGYSDTICAIICDIHHQGRASVATVSHALHSNNPQDNLLQIGADIYKERINTLSSEINRLITNNIFGHKNYSIKNNDFL